MPIATASSSQSGLSVTAASNIAQRRITPLSHKPLPSPPVARPGTTSPIRAGRSLLDASDKPLRRSPPDMPHKQEEWPTLSPHKSSKSVTPEKHVPQPSVVGAAASPKSMKLGQVERFPVSGAVSHPTPPSQGYSVSRVTSPQQTGRKQVSTNPPTNPDAPELSKDEGKTGPDVQTASGVFTGAAKQTLPPSAEMNFHQRHLQNVGSLTDVTNQLVDFSSLGSSLKSSRRRRLDEDTKEGTTKIEDVSYSLSTNHLRQRSAKSKIPSLQKTDTFSADDPFFDGRSRNARGKDRPSASTAQLSVPKVPREGISSEGELSVNPLLGKTVDGENDHGKQKTAEKQFTTQDQSHIASGLLLRHPCKTETPRDAPDSTRSKGVIIPSKNANQDLPTIPAPAFGVERRNRHNFPPRVSSRTMPADYTISAKSSPISSSVILEPPQSAEYFNLHSGQGSFVTDAPAPLDLADGELKCDSVAHESDKFNESTSKGVISNIRGLFHKRSSDTSSSSSAKPVMKDSLNVAAAGKASFFTPLTDIHPANRPTLASASRSTRTGVRNNFGESLDTLASLSPASPLPEDCPSMALAMRLLDSVRSEENSIQKERVLKLSTIMVEAISQVREAEKAVEEAKQAMRKAELAHLFCKKGCREIVSLIEQWRNDMGME